MSLVWDIYLFNICVVAYSEELDQSGYIWKETKTFAQIKQQKNLIQCSTKNKKTISIIDVYSA